MAAPTLREMRADEDLLGTTRARRRQRTIADDHACFGNRAQTRAITLGVWDRPLGRWLLLGRETRCDRTGHMASSLM